MTPEDAQFADAAIRKGFISIDKLLECAGQESAPLKDLLLEKGHLTSAQQAEILNSIENPGPHNPELDEENRFLEQLVRRGLLGFHNVFDCVRLREKMKKGDKYLKSLDEILVENNLLTPVQIHAIRSEIQPPRVMIPEDKDSAIGQLALRRGYITIEQLHEALLLQRNIRGAKLQHRVGEILLQKGYLTAERLDELLSLHASETIGIDIPGYKVLSKIGKGGMGEVFKARQLSMDRLVAVKVLNEEWSADQAYVERFLTEAKLAAQLDHPFIVKAIDAGRAHEKMYYIMEFIDGKTTEDLMHQKGRLSERDCVKIGQYVARGLEYAHKLQLIHRDIKPSNIMVNREGVVKLCDLGLARKVDGTDSVHGTTMVSGYYVAPEIVLGQRADMRSDIYSLGATLYHLSTGQPMFDAPSLEKLCRMHVTESANPPHRLNPDLSEDFSLVVMKMLRKRPDERYPDPTTVVRDLSGILRHVPLMSLRMEDIKLPRSEP